MEGETREGTRACAGASVRAGCSEGREPRGDETPTRASAHIADGCGVQRSVSNPKLRSIKKALTYDTKSNLRRARSVRALWYPGHTLVSPHFLYGLSRMSSALPWNGSRNTGIAAVLFPTRITSSDVTSTTAAGSTSVDRFAASAPPRAAARTGGT